MKKTRTTPGPKKNKVTGDLHDSKADEKRLQGDEAIIDVPEIKDIAPEMEEDPATLDDPAAVGTIASADEEGEGLLDDLNTGEEDDVALLGDDNVSREEAELLQKSERYLLSKDEQRLSRASMDTTDADGDPLNEAGFSDDTTGDETGEDLDVPGSDEDDLDESLGEEDEENNAYSLGADKEDLDEGDPS